MKKFICLVAAALVMQSAFCQIVTSNTRMNSEKKKSEWYFKAGVNIMNLAGSDADELDANAGYKTAFGFHRNIGARGAYWGMDFGVGSRGFKIDDVKMNAHNVQYSPFNFGWKYEVIRDLKIDGHLGVFAAYDFAGKMKGDGGSIKLKDIDDWNNHDAGMNIGVGVWYRRLNFDLTYQRGFIKTIKDVKGYTSNFIISLGVAF